MTYTLFIVSFLLSVLFFVINLEKDQTPGDRFGNLALLLFFIFNSIFIWNHL